MRIGEFQTGASGSSRSSLRYPQRKPPPRCKDADAGHARLSARQKLDIARCQKSGEDGQHVVEGLEAAGSTSTARRGYVNYDAES
jgi:hypothetical protein